MATEIKAIRCPSCGSVKVKELRTDHYQCESCGTEFFLDSDNVININQVNINHYDNLETSTGNAGIHKPNNNHAGCITVILLLVCFIGCFFWGKVSKNDTGNTDKYHWAASKTSKECLFTDTAGNPYYVIAGSIETSGDDFFTDTEDSNIYLGLFNLKDSKLQWIKKLSGSTANDFDNNIDFQLFDDKNLYIIINKSEVYRLNTATLTLEDMKMAYEQKDTDLKAGIATIAFIEDNGVSSGFQIITNDGINLWYMPLINKTYTETEFNKAAATPSSHSATKTAYNFLSLGNIPDSDWGIEDDLGVKFNLIKYKYSYEYGAPRSIPNLEKRKNYNIMIPNRNFFNATVLDFDSARILINFQPDSTGGMWISQILNADNARIMISVRENASGGKLLKGGFALIADGYAVYYDNNGKEINRIFKYDLKFDKVTN